MRAACVRNARTNSAESSAAGPYRVADLDDDLEQRLEDNGREEDDKNRHSKLRDLRGGRLSLEHVREGDALLESRECSAGEEEVKRGEE